MSFLGCQPDEPFYHALESVYTRCFGPLAVQFGASPAASTAYVTAAPSSAAAAAASLSSGAGVGAALPRSGSGSKSGLRAPPLSGSRVAACRPHHPSLSQLCCGLAPLPSLVSDDDDDDDHDHNHVNANAYAAQSTKRAGRVLRAAIKGAAGTASVAGAAAPPSSRNTKSGSRSGSKAQARGGGFTCEASTVAPLPGVQLAAMAASVKQQQVGWMRLSWCLVSVHVCLRVDLF